MVTLFKNISTFCGERCHYQVNTMENVIIDASELTLLPALITPHAHFCLSKPEHSEDWENGSQAAIAGGVTTIFDMPDCLPLCVSYLQLIERRQAINKLRANRSIFLRYYLYLDADVNHFNEIERVKDEIIGIKLSLEFFQKEKSSHKEIENIFSLAAKYNLVVIVQLENREKNQLLKEIVSINAIQKVTDLANQFNTHLYIFNVSTKNEIDFIRASKNKRKTIYAETSPIYLLNQNSYENSQALWQGIEDGTIDAIGNDTFSHHAEDIQDKSKIAFFKNLGLKLWLPLMLDAYQLKKISLEKIIAMTSLNIIRIFGLPQNRDVVIVDLNKVKTIDNPFLMNQQVLKGWPVYTILREKVYQCDQLEKVEQFGLKYSEIKKT